MTEEAAVNSGIGRRAFMAGTMALAGAAALWPKDMRAAAANRNFAAALGWTTYDLSLIHI